MIRLLLIVIGWPLVVILLVSSYQWYREAWPQPPGPWASATEVSYSAAQRQGRRALERFSRLAPAEQEDIAATLAATLVRPAPWFARLDAADPDVLCIGEMHTPETRRFLAQRFFARYRVDRLLLEVTPEKLERIERWVQAGRTYTPLLGADIGAILRNARAENPAVGVRGIEETTAQWRTRERFEGSRDRSLARNFWEQYRPGDRHVVLYGALHCADEPGWFFHYLREQSPPRAGLRMRNIQVIGEHQFQPLASFVHFLDGLGLAPGHFVIEDPRRLHPLMRSWFGLLDQQVFQRFHTVIVFRGAPGWPVPTTVTRRTSADLHGPIASMRPGPRALRTGVPGDRRGG